MLAHRINRVSIPHRQAKNRRTFETFEVTKEKFQFLIGRLKTSASKLADQNA